MFGKGLRLCHKDGGSGRCKKVKKNIKRGVSALEIITVVNNGPFVLRLRLPIIRA